MGWRKVVGLLACALAGCGVQLGYGDDQVVVQQAGEPENPANAVLDAQVVDPPAAATSDAGVVIDAEADASMSSPPPAPTPPAPPPGKRVFVSSSSSNANLGGVSGADTRCQNLADAANLGGAWRAWISSSASSPSGRFTKATIPYRLVDGTIIANDWNDLTSGGLRHAIDRDEKNVPRPAAEVWTATTSTGAYEGGGCNGFTSSSSASAYAAQGVSDRASAQWTNVYLQFCDRTNPRIYCFEQ